MGHQANAHFMILSQCLPVLDSLVAFDAKGFSFLCLMAL